MAEETRRVRELVEATTAEARSVRGEVESHVAQMAAAAEANAARAAEHVTAEVKRVAAYSDAQASRVAADVTARLEHEVQAAATSTAATAELTMRTVVEGVRRDIQAQLDANRADALKRSEEYHGFIYAHVPMSCLARTSALDVAVDRSGILCHNLMLTVYNLW